MRTLDQILEELPASERKAVDARAKKLIAAYSLKQVRQAVAKTQEDVADVAGIGQENISRLEGRDDMLISTLSNYIEALGGKLRLVAEMPGAPVEIALGQSRKLHVRLPKPQRAPASRKERSSA